MNSEDQDAEDYQKAFDRVSCDFELRPCRPKDRAQGVHIQARNTLRRSRRAVEKVLDGNKQ